MAAAPECLVALVEEQRQSNNGGNGLAVAMTPEELRDYRAAAAFKLTQPTNIFSMSSLEPNAESSLHLKVSVLSDELAAAHMCHKSLEPAALLYITKNFAGEAQAIWSAGLTVAKQTLTASGIGSSSVVYRALMRMLKAYENTNAVCKARDDFAKLRWAGTVAATQVRFARVLTEYNIVAARTAGMDEVNRLEPLSFNRILVKLREVCPSWAEERIIANPANCGTLADVWVLLAKHEPKTAAATPASRARLNMISDFARDPRSFEEFYGRRLPEDEYWRLQAAYSAVDAGDVDMARLLLRDDEDLLGVLPLHNADVADKGPRQTALFALSHAAMASNGRPITCWRCGDKENPHRLCDCPAPMSAEEKAGAHRSLWPRVQPVRTTIRAGPRPAVLPTPPVLQLSYPDANLGAQVGAMRQDIDRLQASIMQLVAPAAGAMGAPLLQLAVPPTVDATNDVARVCCAPRGGTAPAGHRHVAQDDTFDWFAPAGASDEAINQAFQQWPGSGN